jgi:hypothetical protein
VILLGPATVSAHGAALSLGYELEHPIPPDHCTRIVRIPTMTKSGSPGSFAHTDSS